MRRVLLVVQPSASHYRAPLIRELAKSSQVDYVLLGRTAGASTGGANSVPQADLDVMSHVLPIRDRKLFGNFSWQSGLIERVFRENVELCVFEGNPYKVSTWFAVGAARIKGKRVAYWGHGWKRPDSSFKLYIRKCFYRLASGHLIYGEWAKLYAGLVGLDAATFYPVFNSIYHRRSIEAVRSTSELATRDSWRNESLSLIYSGRLTDRHEVDLLVRAVTQLRSAGLRIIVTIVGDGETRKRLEASVKDDAEGFSFLGAVYDQTRLQELYRDSDFAISPGASGLNVIQALGFGIPVIAANGHSDSGPEVEAVVEGVTGLLFEAGSVEALKDAIMNASGIGRKQYLTMREAAFDLVLEKYTAEGHAHAIEDALERIAAEKL